MPGYEEDPIEVVSSPDASENVIPADCISLALHRAIIRGHPSADRFLDGLSERCLQEIVDTDQQTTVNQPLGHTDGSIVG